MPATTAARTRAIPCARGTSTTSASSPATGTTGSSTCEADVTSTAGKGLRTYPVEVRSGEVWIDLSDPPFAERRAEILASLGEARADNAYNRMSREIARLHRLGADPLDALREAIHWSSEHMEFGWTHAYAGVADWLALYDENEGDDETRLACVLEGLAHIADDVLREPRHPFPDAAARAYEEEAFVGRGRA